MFLIIHACNDTRPETTRWIERSARVVHADEFCDEEGEADTDGGDESSCSASASMHI
jgi:hypothetical protein